MNRLSIPRAVLAAAYALLCAAGIVSAFSGNASVIQIILLSLIIITLLALVGKAGRWAQIVGLIVGSLYSAIGVAGFGLGVWATATGDGSGQAMLIIGALLLALGVPTVWFLRSDISTR